MGGEVPEVPTGLRSLLGRTPQGLESVQHSHFDGLEGRGAALFRYGHLSGIRRGREM